MRVSHAASAVSVSFSDPNLVASAGLVPVVRLAQECGLPALVGEHVRLGVTTGANPAGKAMTIVAGMCAGADSIDDLEMLRTGGTDRLFGGVYAPSTIVTASTPSSRPVIVATWWLPFAELLATAK